MADEKCEGELTEDQKVSDEIVLHKIQVAQLRLQTARARRF